MTWRSAINNPPPWDEVDPFPPDGYEEWLEKVMAEPWVTALEDLVKWTKVWVGTEEQLIEEIEIRVGKEVSASPDFPSTFEQLDDYILHAIDGFRMKDLMVMDYREISEEDLEDFDVAGWGPEAPIVVFEGDAAHRPEYWEVMCRFLTYKKALPLAVLIFTGEDSDFRKWGAWTGTTKQLINKLRKHYPHPGPVPYRLARYFWARDDGSLEFSFTGDPDCSALLVHEDYLGVAKLMRNWAPILKEEARIKVSWEKVRYSARSPETDKMEQRHRTYWTIEAPRWYKPDDMFGYDASEKNIYAFIHMWLAPEA